MSFSMRTTAVEFEVAFAILKFCITCKTWKKKPAQPRLGGLGAVMNTVYIISYFTVKF